MSLTLGRTRLSVRGLGLLFPLALALLGGRTEAAALLVALAVHEGAHLLAARCLGVGVRELRLMPFGGAIELENPYVLAPGRLFAVAAAGPLASAMAALAAAALCRPGVLSPALALPFLRVNAALGLFNLLPALPLDGGRMLFAALTGRMGRVRAVNVGLWLGRIVAALLLDASVYGAFRSGRFNLSFALAAVFIVASGEKERAALAGARVETVLSQLRPILEPIQARLWAVSGACSVHSALRVARADALTVYAVYDGSRLSSFTDDRRLLEIAAERGGETTIFKGTRVTADPPRPATAS